MARMANIDNNGYYFDFAGVVTTLRHTAIRVHESSIAVLFRHAIATEGLDQEISACGHNVAIKAYVSYQVDPQLTYRRHQRRLQWMRVHGPNRFGVL